MKLADKYSLVRFEEACQRALIYTPRPSFKTIQTILKTGQDKLVNQQQSDRKVSTRKDAATYGFVRGADYFGGRDNE